MSIYKIAIINKIASEAMFIVSEKNPLLFNKHYQCYEEVTPAKPQIKVAYLKDFSCYLPLSESKAQGDQVCLNSKFICARYDWIYVNHLKIDITITNIVHIHL